MTDRFDRHVVIVGAMGVGKSTLAAGVAERLGRPPRDSDADIEALTGRTGAELAADPAIGVAGLHELERAVLLGALAHPEPLVISAAASVVEAAVVRAALNRLAVVVRIEAPTPVILERQATSPHRRAMTAEQLQTLEDRRRVWVDEVVDVRVDGLRPPAALIDEVVRAIDEIATAGP